MDGTVATATDGSIGWPLDRWYRSHSTDNRDLSPAWSTGLGFDVHLQLHSNGTITLIDPGQTRYDFTVNGDGTYGTAGGAYALMATSTGTYEVDSVDGRTFIFDGNGNLTSASQPDAGASISFAYEQISGGRTRMQSAADTAANATTLFYYNDDGTLRETDLPSGQTYTYGYRDGMLASVTKTGVGTTSYGYTANGMLQTISANNRNYVIQYYPDGRVMSLASGAGTVSFKYDAYSGQTPDCPNTGAATETVVTEPGQPQIWMCWTPGGALLTTGGTYVPPTETGNLTAAYDATSNQTLLQWDTAQSAGLADGTPGSPVTGYQIAYQINGGTWSTAQTVTIPQLLLPGGAVGQQINVRLTATNQAGQTSAQVTTSAASAAFQPPDGGPINCQPTESGYAAACVTTVDPDTTDTSSGVATTQAATPRSSGSGRWSVDLLRAGTNGAGGPSLIWASIRNAPQQPVIGNMRDGWEMTEHGQSPGTGASGSKPSIYGAIVDQYGGALSSPFVGRAYSSFSAPNCGWVQLGKRIVNGVLANQADGCPSQTANNVDLAGTDKASAPGTSAFALVLNCVHTGAVTCNDGSATTTINTTTVRECANVTPFPEIRVAAGTRQCRDYAGRLPPHSKVYFRYITTDGQWALIRDNRHRAPGRPNWLFVDRRWLAPSLCAKAHCVLPGP